MRYLVTGGAGFIGSNFVKHLMSGESDHFVVNLDVLTYAGNLYNLEEVEGHANYVFVKGSIANRELVDLILEQYSIDTIVNFAAESHVDRSITGPDVFVKTNVLGTQCLLDAARAYGISKFVQVSTDEVYGSLGETGYFTEETPLAPSSPYSASKTAADLLVKAYHETYGMNVNITRCSNNYGPNHFPEKLIPLLITNALQGKELPIYGDGSNVRDWLHVRDHCQAIDLVVHKGRPGEVYNIGGHNEKTNNEIVQMITDQLNVSKDLITYVADRPGHDKRYAIDPTKITTELGWKPSYYFEEGLKETVEWYLENEGWWKNIMNGSYVTYHPKKSGDQLCAH
ncbi:spore coat protein [Jeotgalibacillus alimentarius]|uniref:dTDP-glucose 4,6-dehydratase n=1 Tax=Jeotgalibacillus alimentarius TaxID=135826 RepID=A0A0C2VHU0_9BACL|nr:dTDP-glucose 4,6-dehydratase [Jeotgalibacillus alimentarius]KIL43553.1 spore coat protein [Jeotgalibacillus alimentarius]